MTRRAEFNTGWALVVGCTLLAALLASDAGAREYSVEVRVDSVEDLYDLADAGELEEDELDLLIALFNRPMDVNRADRYALYDLPGVSWALVDAIIARRAEVEGFTLLEDLRDVPGMTEAIFQSLRPFAMVRETVEGAEAKVVSGRASAGAVYQGNIGDDLRQTRFPENGPSGYLVAEADGFDYFSAGAQLIMRPLVSPDWDRSTGFLVDEGASCDPTLNNACLQQHFSLRDIYATADYGPWRIIAGTYRVGFAQRLTIDNTGSDNPRMWEKRLVTKYSRSDGAVRSPKNMRGAAVSLDGVDTPIGWVDATGFVSYQSYDVYRDDIWYSGDDYFEDMTCETDSDCPDGYTCKVTNRCATSRVNDVATGKAFAFPSYQDFFSELIGGGNVTFNFDERTSVGVTAYRSHVDINLPDEAGAGFSPSAIYPRRADFGAASIDGRFGWEFIEAAAEIGITHEGAPAGVIEVITNPLDWIEATGSLRWYSRDYDNPHSRSDAAATETLGSRRRNQRGGRLQLELKPISGLKLVTKLDIYDHAWAERYVNGDLQWVWDPITYLRSEQRVTYDVTHAETVGLQVTYNNNDLNENGRSGLCDERTSADGFRATGCGFYTSEDFDSVEGLDSAGLDVDARELGRGEKWNLVGSIASTRLWDIRMSLRGAIAFVDAPGAEYATSFAVEGYLRFGLSTKLPWDGARLAASVKYWPDQAPLNTDEDFYSWVAFQQRFWDNLLWFDVFYGVFADARVVQGNVDPGNIGFAGSVESDPILDFGHIGGVRVGSRF